MSILRLFKVFAAGATIGSAMMPNVMAQATGSFADADFRSYVVTTCQALGPQFENLDNDGQDLFLRCNGALNAQNVDGSTDPGDILDQYLGVQSLAAQSDGLSRTNRADQFVAARLNVISGQVRGGQYAELLMQRPVQLASNDPDSVDLSGATLSREGKWDGFASLGGFQTEQDSTSDELGFEVDGFWFAGGVDYRFNQRFIAGAAVSYVDSQADFDSIGNIATGTGGSTSSESTSVSLYGSYLVSDPLALNAFEVNGLVSVGQVDFETERRIVVVDKNANFPSNGGTAISPGGLTTINRTAISKTDADTVQLSIGASYSTYFANGVSLTPTANFTYYNADIGAFAESGSQGLDLIFDSQEIDSLQASIGANVSRPFSADWGVAIPYVRASAVFELEDGAQTVTGRYAAQIDQNNSFTISTNDADETVLDLALGATAQFANGASAFAEYSTILGLENVDHQALSVGVRFQF
ncbi:MAG: autotransporter outer membrane beta-barrel domain-containing protein [Pseudomonadota bacterium]